MMNCIVQRIFKKSVVVYWTLLFEKYFIRIILDNFSNIKRKQINYKTKAICKCRN